MINDKPLNTDFNVLRQNLKADLAQQERVKSSEKAQNTPKSEPLGRMSKDVEAEIIAPEEMAKSNQQANAPSPVLSEKVKAELLQKVQEAIPKVRELMQKNQRSLDFKVAEDENRVIITVIDKETDRVIRQIPPEDILLIADAIEQGMDDLPDGVIVNYKA